jgi:hypothetical protein
MEQIEKQIIQKIKELDNFNPDKYNELYFFNVLKLIHLNKKYLNESNLKINIYLNDLLNNIFTHPSILIKENEPISDIIRNVISNRIVE